MTEQINIDMHAGSLVWWKASLCSSRSLKEAMRACGIRQVFREIKPDFALMQAVTSRYYTHPSHHRGQLIRKAKAAAGKSAVVVVREELADDGNKYESALRFEIDHGTWEVTCDGHPSIDTETEALKYRGMVLGREVGTGFGKIFESFGCTKLRDGAKIYFVAKSLQESVARLVGELDGMGVPVKFLKTHCPVDADTAAGIADNAMEQFRASYQEVMTEIETVDSAMTIVDASQRDKLNDKRNKLLAKLDAIKQQAERIDEGFRGLLNIADEIGSEIETARALAVLATVTH